MYTAVNSSTALEVTLPMGPTLKANFSPVVSTSTYVDSFSFQVKKEGHIFTFFTAAAAAQALNCLVERLGGTVHRPVDGDHRLEGVKN
ncbi:hypothetical protein TYRP_015116 [Tyrophagus putrescentiae]|nr:hypothetical protein TYRP_015116 [Tyrophagus putrescentiae]